MRRYNIRKRSFRGTVHKILTATSDWQSFDVVLKRTGLKINIQLSGSRTSISKETLDKIVTRNNVTASPPPKKTTSQKVKSVNNKELKPRFFVQNRGNIIQTFASRLRKLCNIQIIFTTRELRTCLPTLKSSFDKNFKSHVVYKSTCNGCSSIYVGQTIQNVTTRILEHLKKDSPVEQHLVEFCGTAHNIE